jgi:hypothetical protein
MILLIKYEMIKVPEFNKLKSISVNNMRVKEESRKEIHYASLTLIKKMRYISGEKKAVIPDPEKFKRSKI